MKKRKPLKRASTAVRLPKQGERAMKYRSILTALALASGLAVPPASAEDLTLEFVVWN